MFRTALRNVLAHKARLLMTVLAVMLGVAFVSGTLVFTDTISDAFQKSSAKGYDDVDVAVQPRPPTTTATRRQEARPAAQPAALLDKVGRLPGAALRHRRRRPASPRSPTRTASSSAAASTTRRQLLPGADGKDAPLPADRAAARPQGPTRSRSTPRPPQRAATRSATPYGSSIDGPVQADSVAGVFTTDDGRRGRRQPRPLRHADRAAAVLPSPACTTRSTVKAASGHLARPQLQATRSSRAAQGRRGRQTGKQLADDQAEQIERRHERHQDGLLVFAGIALFVGIFLIANTFTMLVAQRTKELALLRAVGASRRQVTRSVLIEAFVVGAVAAVRRAGRPVSASAPGCAR